MTVSTASPTREEPPPFVTATVCGAGSGPPATAVKVTVVAESAMLGGGTTVILAVAVNDSTVALIVVVPNATPETSPVAETVAMPGLPLAQAVGTPTNGTPLASCTTAVSWRVVPTMTSVLSGDTASEAIVSGPTEVSVVQATATTTAAARSERGRISCSTLRR